MNRLEKLFQKYSDIPRSIVLKEDVLRAGIRYTPLLSEVGQWALPQTHFIFEFDHEDLHTPEQTGKGWAYVPCEASFPDGTTFLIILDSGSLYELRRQGDRFALYLQEEPLEEVLFPQKPDWYSQETSDGALMATVGSKAGDCLVVMCTNYCEYFKTDDACRFCCLNPTYDRSRELGIERAVSRDAHRFAETYAVARNDVHHMVLSGGGFIDRKREASLYLRMIEGLAEAGLHPEHLWIITQAFDREDAARLKEVGVETICYPMEVWQEEMWPVVVPGKHKFVGRQRWIEALLEAVEVFGWGNVMSQFVGGCELAPPSLLKSVEEAVESTATGFEWLLQNGVIPRFTCWSNNPGSRYAGLQAPPTDYYLELGLRLHRLLESSGMDLPASRCHRCNGLATHYDFQRLMGRKERVDQAA